MRDGRPNPDIWGNIITCGEIAVGIYEIVGTKKRGLEVPKALAEEILPVQTLGRGGLYQQAGALHDLLGVG